MEKTKFHNNVFFPMPMTIVGSIINYKPNYMAVGWVSRINANPPMLVMGINNRHFTIKGILENNEFSVNIPSENILTETDYVGIVSLFKVKTIPLYCKSIDEIWLRLKLTERSVQAYLKT